MGHLSEDLVDISLGIEHNKSICLEGEIDGHWAILEHPAEDLEQQSENKMRSTSYQIQGKLTR